MASSSAIALPMPEDAPTIRKFFAIPTRQSDDCCGKNALFFYCKSPSTKVAIEQNEILLTPAPAVIWYYQHVTLLRFFEDSTRQNCSERLRRPLLPSGPDPESGARVRNHRMLTLTESSKGKRHPENVRHGHWTASPSNATTPAHSPP